MPDSASDFLVPSGGRWRLIGLRACVPRIHPSAFRTRHDDDDGQGDDDEDEDDEGMTSPRQGRWIQSAGFGSPEWWFR